MSERECGVCGHVSASHFEIVRCEASHTWRKIRGDDDWEVRR